MPVEDADVDALKKWTIKKLEDISDADSDVLADYVLALVKSDDPESTSKANCVDSLRDFLGDNAEAFVEEVFSAIESKSYDPSKPVQRSTNYAKPPVQHGFEQQSAPVNSRKRGYRDWDGEVAGNGGGERAIKQPRRGGRATDRRGGRIPQGQGFQQRYSQAPSLPFMPPGMPPGMPIFDPNDPWAAMKAMNDMIGFFSGGQMSSSTNNTIPNQRCRDYDEKGVCMAGASCPYEHGDNPVVVSNRALEYDPNHASLLDVQPSRVGHFDFQAGENGQRGGRRRGRGSARGRGGSQRADISFTGRSKDRSNRSLVIEHIPLDKCDEENIRAFFAEFGNVEEVQVQPAKRLATIRYDSHESALGAYDSPKVVFDNRFVKVYWLKRGDSISTDGTRPNSTNKRKNADMEMQDAETVDLEEISRKQEDAQRKYEEAKRQREEADKQKQDLDMKLKAMEAERKKMAAALAKKTAPADADIQLTNGSDESEKTKELKEQLAKLEAEAKSLGIDPDAPVVDEFSSYSTYRGRGSFRGRPRGRGYGAFRGGWVGARGGVSGAVMRLDNRPKQIAVVFDETSRDFNTQREKTGQFMLFNNLTYASIAPHPERDDAALIGFDQRFEGENFMKIARDGDDLPYIGNVQLSWYKSPPISSEAGPGSGKESSTFILPTEEQDAALHEAEHTDEMIENDNLDVY